jgi:hypothetical protein
MSWIDSRAFQAFCPDCRGTDLVARQDYDSVQGRVLLLYCRQCRPVEAEAAFASDPIPELAYALEAERAKAFGREPGWRKFDPAYQNAVPSAKLHEP